MLSAVTVVEGPGDLLTLPTIRQHCRIYTADEDELLKLYAETAVQRAETFLARSLLTQTLQWVLMEHPPPAFAQALPGLFTYPGDWLGFPHLLQRPLLLPRSPVQSVTAVALGDPQGGPDLVLDPSAWVADVALQPARLRICSSWMACPMRHVAVTFTAGYGAPAAVPAPIRTAVLMTILWLYENRGDGEGDMPPVAERLLWPYRMVSFGE